MHTIRIVVLVCIVVTLITDTTYKMNPFGASG